MLGNKVILPPDSLFQAKNEPAGKKTSDKREGEGKKEKSSNADRYYSSRGDCGQGDPFLHFTSFTFSTDGEGCEAVTPFTFLHSLRTVSPLVLGDDSSPSAGSLFSILLMPLRQPPHHLVLIARVLSSSLAFFPRYLFSPTCVWGVIFRSANLKREEKPDRKDDAKKSEDGSGEKSKDQDDQKPGPSERSRTTKSGS